MDGEDGEDIIKFEKLSDKATLPTRGSAASAGLDLSASETIVVTADTCRLIRTDLKVAVCK